MRKVKRWATLMLSMLLLTETASVQAVSFMTGTITEAESESEQEFNPNDSYWEEDSNEQEGSASEEEEVYYDVDLEQWYYNLTAGETVQLVLSTNAPANEITYTSSDETIATVSNTGLVTAVNGGETGWGSATITVTWKSSSGKYTSYDSCTIHVENTLTLDKSSDVIYTKVKTKYKLKAVSNPASKIHWKSSDKRIATVNDSGVITPKKAGNVTITAMAGGISQDCYITVKEPYFELDKTVTAYLKHKLPLNTWMEPSNKITWKSSNPKIATVDAKGVVTGKKKGTVTITAKVNGLTRKCKVTVEEPSISVWQKDISIYAGSIYNLYVNVRPYTAKVKWTSSNNKVVKVDKDGTITALKPGTAKVTASINGGKAVCQIKIVKDTCKLNNTKRIMTAGEKIKIYVQKPSNLWSTNYTVKESNGVVSLSSENGICTVTANTKGNAQVLVSFSVYENGNTVYYRKPCNIKVVNSGISQQQFSIAKGKTKTLKMVNIGEKKEIASIKWSSTAPKIATINASTGVVKGIKSGTAKIKSVVTYMNGKKKTYTATVKVSEPKLSASSVVVALQGNNKITLKGTNEYSNIQWKSSNKSIVAVDIDGTLRPYKTGTATIKVIVDGVTLSCKVYITNPQLENFYARRVVGTQVKIPVKGLHEKSRVTYNSSNTSIASVDNKGNINVVGGGRAEIQVNADGKELTYIVESASQRAIDACDKGYGIISTSRYSQENRMAEGFYDCSSLVFKAYGRNVGMLGGNSAGAPTAAGMAQHMANTGKVLAWTAVSLEQLRPGDLIFYGQQNNGRYLGIYHVSMYYGDGLRLESPLDYYWERDNIVMVARPAP